MTRPELFDYWFTLAYSYAKEYDQDISVILAQAAIETGYGRSELYTKYKNVSGMKVGSGKGYFSGSVNMTTREVIEGKDIYIKDNFRTYSTVGQSFRDLCFRHQRFGISLTGSGSRSAYLAKNVSVCGIQKSGYATDTRYISLINSVIRDNDLDQYQDKTETNKASLWPLAILAALALIGSKA